MSHHKHCHKNSCCNSPSSRCCKLPVTLIPGPPGIGVTGPTGATGPIGFTGATGPSSGISDVSFAASLVEDQTGTGGVIGLAPSMWTTSPLIYSSGYQNPPGI